MDFRADFGPVAHRIMVVKVPGAVRCDHRELIFRRLRPGLRLILGTRS